MDKAVPITAQAVGTAEAISTVQVRSQVDGRIAQIHFAEGRDVDAGQPLFTIDPRPFQVELDRSTAVLARDTAEANNAQAQVERYENLFKRGLIPRDQYEAQVATAGALKATTAADEAAVAAARLNRASIPDSRYTMQGAKEGPQQLRGSRRRASANPSSNRS